MNTPSFSVKLEKKDYLTKDIVELHFSKPPGFTFQAGQFVQFEIPDGDKMVLRSYSISSTPRDEDFEFCVKILEGGKASGVFKNLQIGENLSIRGPRGMFTNNETTPLYCIATGAGLAPIMGIIQDELKNKRTTTEIKLLFGVREEQDIFWADRLETMARAHENFTYDITLSQPKPNGGWSGLRGRVTDHFLHHLVNHHFFLCGNAAMVKDVREILLKNGVENKNIHFEIF